MQDGENKPKELTKFEEFLYWIVLIVFGIWGLNALGSENRLALLVGCIYFIGGSLLVMALENKGEK